MHCYGFFQQTYLGVSGRYHRFRKVCPWALCFGDPCSCVCTVGMCVSAQAHVGAGLTLLCRRCDKLKYLISSMFHQSKCDHICVQISTQLVAQRCHKYYYTRSVCDSLSVWYWVRVRCMFHVPGSAVHKCTSTSLLHLYEYFLHLSEYILRHLLLYSSNVGWQRGRRLANEERYNCILL